MEKALALRASTKATLEDAVKVATSLAVTGEVIADTCARLADQRPLDAARLRARSELAQRWAARARQWAAERPGERAGRQITERIA